MNVKDKILVVEDEASITRFIRAILCANGYDVVTAASGAEAYSMLSSHCPDLVLLDLGLPDIDGMQIIESVRQWTQVPIIVVSARSFDRDKVEALDKGSDDYITKPFSAAELLARVRVALRHSRQSPAGDSVAATGKFSTGELTIDYDKHQVLIAGRNAKLTQNEYKIVALLGRYAGKVLTYDFLMKELWGPQSKGSNQILRVHMANIRRNVMGDAPADHFYLPSAFGRSISYLRRRSSIASSNKRLLGILVFRDSSSKSGTSSFFREEVNLVLYFKYGSAILGLLTQVCPYCILDAIFKQLVAPNVYIVYI